jgi:hypothetical protein
MSRSTRNIDSAEYSFYIAKYILLLKNIYYTYTYTNTYINMYILCSLLIIMYVDITMVYVIILKLLI